LSKTRPVGKFVQTELVCRRSM